mgnify:FL=1
MRDRRRVYDAAPNLDGQGDLAEDLAHPNERLAQLGSVLKKSRAGSLVEHEVDGAAAVDVCGEVSMKGGGREGYVPRKSMSQALTIASAAGMRA